MDPTGWISNIVVLPEVVLNYYFFVLICIKTYCGLEVKHFPGLRNCIPVSSYRVNFLPVR
jgi:hypothetical protein